MAAEPVTVALDANGADRGPTEVAQGAAAAAAQGINVLLFGPADQVGSPAPGVEIVHAPVDISKSPDPARAVREHPDASIVQAARAVSEGRAQALVSGGSTGAALASGLFIIKRARGIYRPGLAVWLPVPGKPVLLLDVGASTRGRTEQLIQFAHMGSAFAASVLGVDRPRVGLLSNGSEPSRGTPEIVAANEQLRSQRELSFVGNVEGIDLTTGRADVVVTDGFTGNVSLKLMEGVTDTLIGAIRDAATSSSRAKVGGKLLSGALGELKEQLDPEQLGGAYLLGLRHLVVICHGRFSAFGFTAAVALAERGVRDDIVGRTDAAMSAANVLGRAPGQAPAPPAAVPAPEVAAAEPLPDESHGGTGLDPSLTPGSEPVGADPFPPAGAPSAAGDPFAPPPEPFAPAGPPEPAAPAGDPFAPSEPPAEPFAPAEAQGAPQEPFAPAEPVARHGDPGEPPPGYQDVGEYAEYPGGQAPPAPPDAGSTYWPPPDPGYPPPGAHPGQADPAAYPSGGYDPAAYPPPGAYPPQPPADPDQTRVAGGYPPPGYEQQPPSGYPPPQPYEAPAAEGAGPGLSSGDPLAGAPMSAGDPLACPPPGAPGAPGPDQPPPVGQDWQPPPAAEEYRTFVERAVGPPPEPTASQIYDPFANPEQAQPPPAWQQPPDPYGPPAPGWPQQPPAGAGAAGGQPYPGQQPPAEDEYVEPSLRPNRDEPFDPFADPGPPRGG